MIRTVLFDLDGVIRHFDPDHVAAIERRHGLDTGSIEAFAFSTPVIEDVTTGRIRRADWIAAIADHMDNEAAAAAWGGQPFHPDPEVIELLDELRSAGHGVTVLTNGTDTVPDEVATFGLLDHVDAVFNSADIGFVKPDVRAFQHVLDAIGLDGPEVFFTDDSEHKLSGAAELGMVTHHFTGLDGLRTALSAQGVLSPTR